MRTPTCHVLCLTLIASLLGGCDALGIETATQVAAKKQAEAHAIGSACRHAVRSIEDCFKSNPKATKSAVFAGWKEMDQYMRENQIVGMPGSAAPAPDAAKPAEEEAIEKADPNASDAHSSKS